jgi:hypothetical protein
LIKKDNYIEQLTASLIDYQNEAEKLKALIKQQEDLILTQNNNIFVRKFNLFLSIFS